MRTFGKLAVLAGAAAALACSGRGREPAGDELSADLRRDLDLASAANLKLASAARPYEPTRVVSAVEAVPVGRRPAPTAKAPKPRRAAPPQRVHHAHAEEPAPAPEVDVADAAEQPEAEATVAAATPPEASEPAGEETDTAEPQPAPRPRPIPAGGGIGGAYPGRGPGQGPIGDVIGGVIGGVAGVVIRGGHAGVDHCDERDIAINRRFPVISPTFPTNPTFPTRRRW